MTKVAEVLRVSPTRASNNQCMGRAQCYIIQIQKYKYIKIDTQIQIHKYMLRVSLTRACNNQRKGRVRCKS